MSLASIQATEPTDPTATDIERLAAGAFCVCGCGTHLPGSRHAPTCFGCSVGKADLAFIRESLASGRTPQEIMLELTDPILVEVFADYDDAGLPAIWELAQRVATELNHHRVVLRTRARTASAQRAVALAECSRLDGFFASMQRILIHHGGPWDEDTLLRLAERENPRENTELTSEAVRSCLANGLPRAHQKSSENNSTVRISVGPPATRDSLCSSPPSRHMNDTPNR